MNLYDRWQMAYQSPLGSLLMLLVVVLLLLGLTYWVLMANKRKRDLLASLYLRYYEKAEKTMEELTFIGKHKADFFGRETIVKLAKGELAICLIPPPELALKEISERFLRFHRALAPHSITSLSRYVKIHTQESFVLVKGDLMQQDSRFLLSLTHYLKDAKLSLADREQILLKLAKTLSLLHELKTDAGESLYHGFLLPRSIFLDVDAHRRLSRLIISDVGLAFAISPERLYQRLELLKADRLPIEKYYGQEILEQLSMLAPEQKNLDFCSLVGQKSDFFAFAAIAVIVFTGKRFNGKDLNWSLIPEKWRSFLKACLHDDPASRPIDFLEIEERLSEPEVALTVFDDAEISLNSFEKNKEFALREEVSYATLLQQLQHFHPTDEESLDSGRLKLMQKHLEVGIKGVRLAKWKEAKKSFKEVLKFDPHHAEAHVNLAIICYELKDMKNAEQHYESAKKIDPRLAKSFREHIAFKM